MGKKSDDDIIEMIEISAGEPSSFSPEEMEQALRSMASSADEQRSNDPWLERYHSLPQYTLEVNRDGSVILRI